MPEPDHEGSGKSLDDVMKAASQTEFLRTCLQVSPLFNALPPATLDALSGVARLVTFAPNQRIHSRDDEVHFSGVILSGGIRSSMTSVDGYEFSVSILRRGAYFGSAGVVEPTHAYWDCYAHGHTEMVAIQNRDFRPALDSHPQLGIMLAKAANYRLRKAYLLMSNLVLETLDRRLRRTLVMLVGASEGSERGGIPEIAITQEALGQFVQCSRPTVNKALRDLEDAGIIEIGYGVIRVLDLPSLQKSFESEAILTL